jgi:hypothetical protein
MKYRLEPNRNDWPSYLPYDPVREFIKMKAKQPFKVKVGQYVLVLSDKARFSKGDVGNLALYKLRQIVGSKIYVNSCIHCMFVKGQTYNLLVLELQDNQARHLYHYCPHHLQHH